MRTEAFCRPVGARTKFCLVDQGMNPLAVIFRPVGARLIREAQYFGKYQPQGGGRTQPGVKSTQWMQPREYEQKTDLAPTGRQKISVRLKFVTRNAHSSLCKTESAISFSGYAFSFSIDNARFLLKKSPFCPCIAEKREYLTESA